jgi:hypothetical protein
VASSIQERSSCGLQLSIGVEGLTDAPHEHDRIDESVLNIEGVA